MTRDELAALINGRQYGEELTQGEIEQAKQAGLVVVFGASDDLLELRGAIDDEVGAYKGASAFIAPGRRAGHGSLVDESHPGAIEVEAVWCPELLDASWLIKAEAPSTPFDILEDDDLYCRGAVLDLTEVFAEHRRAQGIRDAALDLYEALKWFIDDIDGTHTVMLDFDENVLRARAALAKAVRS